MAYWFVVAYKVNMEYKAQQTLFVETVNNVLISALGCLWCVTNIGEDGE